MLVNCKGPTLVVSLYPFGQIVFSRTHATTLLSTRWLWPPSDVCHQELRELLNEFDIQDNTHEKLCDTVYSRKFELKCLETNSNLRGLQIPKVLSKCQK